MHDAMQGEVKCGVTGRCRTQRVFIWLSLIALGGIPLTALAVIAFGQAELRGNVAFSLILVSVLANAAILLSYPTIQQVQRISQVSWIIVALACLAFSLYVAALDHPDARKSAEVVLLTGMLVLAFPSGILAVAAVMAYSTQFLAARATSAFELFIFWFLHFALGYLQWFRLGPWIARRARERKQ
jgi:hypothetical protein